METKCRMIIEGIGAALMLAIVGCDDRKTNDAPVSPTNAPHVVTDGVASNACGIVDVDGYTLVGGGRTNSAKEKGHTRRERLKALEKARIPLVHDVPPGSRFELFGYVMGQTYKPAASGQMVIYGDRVRCYTPAYPLPENFHGMSNVECELTPTTKRLCLMSLQRTDFAGRTDLMKEGEAVLGDLEKKLGHKMAPFKFEAPDGPYWPCGFWSGPIPDLFVADETQWATSKNVFAVSRTKIGGVSVNVKLDVVSFDHFKLFIEAKDEALASEGSREFDEDFKKHHEGKSFHEWSKEMAFRRSPEYSKNQKRQPFPNDFNVAGCSFGGRVDPATFAKRFGPSAFYYTETSPYLPEEFRDVFSRIDAATNAVGCIYMVNFESDFMTSAEQALAKYGAVLEYLLKHGMDEYYEETVGTAQEIKDFYKPNGNSWAWHDFCNLKWIDKDRRVEIGLTLHVAKKDGMKIRLFIRQAPQGWATDYQWSRGLKKFRNGEMQE